MTTVTWRTLTALMLAMALVVTACGEGQDPTVEPEPDPETTPDEDGATGAERADGVLRLGYILPETGQLQFLGPPMITATEFAVQEINDAGGVFGEEVELLPGDEAGDTAIAAETAQQHLDAGVDAIIGAAASGMSMAIIDAVTGAGVVQCSPSNTGPAFTEYPDDGFYFRTAPTDALQGPVLAETIVGDGHSRVALLARSDDYGQGLADSTREALEEQGAEVVEEILYDPEAATFDAEIQQVVDANPDAVAIIAFDEAAQLLQGLLEVGLGPGEFPVYGAESLRSTELPELVDPGDPTVLDGLKGTAPTSDADEEFIDRLQEFREVPDTLFAAESYDCVNIIALAAVAAGSDDPGVFVDEMIDVTRDGTSCSSYEECVQLLGDGEDIAYEGASGFGGLTDAGEPGRGLYEVWQFTDAEIETLEEIESTLD